MEKRVENVLSIILFRLALFTHLVISNATKIHFILLSIEKVILDVFAIQCDQCASIGFLRILMSFMLGNAILCHKKCQFRWS